MVFVAAWRGLSKRPAVQAPLHRILGSAAVVGQWYTLFFTGIIYFGALSIFEYFAHYASIGAQQVDYNLREVFDRSQIQNRTFDEFKEDLTIPMWVKVLNMIGQLSGIAVIGIVTYHAWALLILPAKTAAQENGVWRDHPWHVPKRVNWLLWIIVLPAVFSIETMRANIKVWGIMVGTAPEYSQTTFTLAQKLELLYAHEDLQVASMWQFTAIYAFTRLISSMFDTTAIIRGHTDEQLQSLAGEYKRLLRLGGFLGIWLYIVAGCVRALVNIYIAVILQFVIDATSDPNSTRVRWFEDMEQAFTGMIGITFTLLTLLSVLNMFIMAKTFIVTDRLGDANRKFLGARVLLICSEIVPKVIDAFEMGTPLFIQTQRVTSFVSFLYMSSEQAEVLKIAVLNIACLVAVIMNLIFWKDLDIEAAGLLDLPQNDAHALLKSP